MSHLASVRQAASPESRAMYGMFAAVESGPKRTTPLRSADQSVIDERERCTT